VSDKLGCSFCDELCVFVSVVVDVVSLGVLDLLSSRTCECVLEIIESFFFY
jgi:hypothetical protein